MWILLAVLWLRIVLTKVTVITIRSAVMAETRAAIISDGPQLSINNRFNHTLNIPLHTKNPIRRGYWQQVLNS
jgi:hypothetical protein